MRRVCEFIDVAYAPGMLAMDELPEQRESGGNSSFGDMEPGAISVRAIGRFAPRCRRPTSRTWSSWLAAPWSAWGTSRSASSSAPSARARFLAWQMPVNGLRMIGWMTQAHFREHRGVRVPQFRLEEPRQGGLRW